MFGPLAIPVGQISTSFQKTSNHLSMDSILFIVPWYFLSMKKWYVRQSSLLWRPMDVQL